MPDVSTEGLFGFALGYCISNCIEKDWVIKPVMCTITYGVCAVWGFEVSYPYISDKYNKFVKPALQAIMTYRNVTEGSSTLLPPSASGLPPVPDIAARIRSHRGGSLN